MSIFRGQWKGARWWKVDLHTHTPASDDYGKGPQQAVLKARNAEEWLLDFMRAGIDCVAITDHNSGEWISRVQAALTGLSQSKPEGYRPLCVFPGVEISVYGGIHVLAILDTEKTTSDVDSLLGAVGYSGTKGASDSVTTKTFIEVVAAITAAGGLAIPAHVDCESGLFKLTGTTLNQALECEEIVAVEVVDSAAAKPPAYAQADVRWTELIGSDSHHPSGPSGKRFPGSHYTWVKMGTPSLDGLRLAFRDGSLSVQRGDGHDLDPNKHASLVLESVVVSEARYMGRPSALSFDLNPWLNAIVGGRGTGKSSTVEFLRLALGRERELPKELVGEFEKYSLFSAARDGSGLLTENTSISVVYVKDGTRFRITRKPAGDQPISIEEHVAGDWVSAPGEVMQRFPVRIYSQKQIFQLAKDPLALLGIVDDEPAVDRRNWGERWGALTNEYMTLAATIRQSTTEAAEESRLKGELADVTRKLAVLAASGHSDILSDFQLRIREQTAWDAWKNSWASTGENVRTFAADLVPPPLEMDGSDAESDEGKQLRSEAAEIRKELETIRSEMMALATRADELNARWDASLNTSTWKTLADAALVAYRELVERLKQEGVGDSEEYAELVKQREVIEGRLAGLEKQRTQTKMLIDRAAALFQTLLDHRRQLTELRRAFLDEVLSGNQYVRIQIAPYGARDTVEDGLRKLLQRELGGFEKDIGSPGAEGLLGRLYSGGSESGSLEVALAEIKRRVREMATGIHDPKAVGDQRFVKHVQGLPPEALDRLDLWFPEDSLEVSYSPSGDRRFFRPISEGSPGQKTAALLAFLLSYGEEPLVLDQPEDDLDNHLIYDLIVTQLREVKRRRQIIAVTHNSNIVVNGDAELVIALVVRGGQTQKECEGCLQETQVREAICKVMEGGREAFKQRYRRIALEAGNG